MHVLTSARSYIYSASKLASEFSNESEQKVRNTFDESRKAAYDNLFGYRLMEAIRNSAQHHGFPIHGFTIGNSWDINNGRKTKNRYLVVPTINVNQLSADEKFKKEILRELKDRGANLDVRPHLREYVYGISSINFDLHSAAEAALSNAEKTINKLIAAYGAKNPSSEINYFIIEKHSKNNERAKVSEFSLRAIDTLHKLALNKHKLPRLDLTYVSTDWSLDQDQEKPTGQDHNRP